MPGHGGLWGAAGALRAGGPPLEPGQGTEGLGPSGPCVSVAAPQMGVPGGTLPCRPPGTLGVRPPDALPSLHVPSWTIFRVRGLPRGPLHEGRCRHTYGSCSAIPRFRVNLKETSPAAPLLFVLQTRSWSRETVGSGLRWGGPGKRPLWPLLSPPTYFLLALRPRFSSHLQPGPRRPAPWAQPARLPRPPLVFLLGARVPCLPWECLWAWAGLLCSPRALLHLQGKDPPPCGAQASPPSCSQGTVWARPAGRRLVSWLTSS